MAQVNAIKFLTRVLIVLSIAVVGATSYFVMSLDVLEYWHVEVTPKEVHAGDTVYATTSYKKVRDAAGIARRYIECKSSNGAFTSYLINEVPADKSSGTSGRTIELPTPRGISNLPTQCRVRISAEYQVLPFRRVLETTISNEFRLLPETEESKIKRESESASVSAPQTSFSQVQSLNRVSSPQSTPAAQEPSVTNDTKPPEQPRRPGVVEQLTGILRSLN